MLSASLNVLWERRCSELPGSRKCRRESGALIFANERRPGMLLLTPEIRRSCGQDTLCDIVMTVDQGGC
ncbi:unnamed protein product [Haemonchus placei]|uniref:Uncharacterized protein n=1 Tax=Haemonchus placei TaxID=6290 RepID=A0A0N4VY91_HAEPC|nr:unnamed protein product [Haemonchus placei]